MTSVEAIGPDEYRSILSRFASGVTVVTSRLDDNIEGMTVSAFSSVSLEPPLVLVCLSLGRPTTKLVAGWYGVNVLSSDQAHLSERFAFTDHAERFDEVDWYDGPNGMPLLANTIGSLECKVEQIHVAGDHLIVVGLVVAASTTEGLPVVYTQRGYHHLGESAQP